MAKARERDRGSGTDRYEMACVAAQAACGALQDLCREEGLPVLATTIAVQLGEKLSGEIGGPVDVYVQGHFVAYESDFQGLGEAMRDRISAALKDGKQLASAGMKPLGGRAQ